MSCSNKCRKSCHDKSCQRFYNNNSQAIEANASTQLVIAGTKVVDSGISIETEPQNYTTLKTGLYHISGDVTINATAAGVAVLQVFMDGVAMPCTKKTISLIAGNNNIHTETDICISACCCDVSHTFTFVITTDATATGSVTEFCSGMLKLA